jgi:hypothetical protein
MPAGNFCRNLAHTRRIYQDLADRAEKENWSYRDFLALLLAEEVAEFWMVGSVITYPSAAENSLH